MSTAFLPGFEAAGNFPVSNRKTSDDLSSTETTSDFKLDVADDLVSIEATPGFKPEMVKGTDSIDTLANQHQCRDEVCGNSRTPPAAKGVISNQTLAEERGGCSTPILISNDGQHPWTMTGTEFRTRQFFRSLTPEQRAVVAGRKRFYSTPWIVPAGQADNGDDLP